MIRDGRARLGATKTPTLARYLFVKLGNITSSDLTLNMSPDSSSWCELSSSCDCLYLCHIFSINGFISLLLSYDKNLSHRQPFRGFCFRSSAQLSVYKDTTLTSTAFCQASNITLLLTDWQISFSSSTLILLSGGPLTCYLALVHYI